MQWRFTTSWLTPPTIRGSSFLWTQPMIAISGFTLSLSSVPNFLIPMSGFCDVEELLIQRRLCQFFLVFLNKFWFSKFGAMRKERLVGRLCSLDQSQRFKPIIKSTRWFYNFQFPDAGVSTRQLKCMKFEPLPWDHLD